MTWRPRTTLPARLAVCAALLMFHGPPPARPTPAPSVKWVDRPLTFERNDGQAEAQVRFVARALGADAYFTDQGPVFLTADARPLRLALPGGTWRQPEAGAPLPGVANYFLGDDATRWHTGIPTFDSVRYREVYPGVDLVFRGTHGSLEYDLLLAPGVDHAQVRVAYEGARPALDPTGCVGLDLPTGRVVQHPPRVFEEGVELAATTVLADDGSLRFQVPAHDRSRAMVIDPTLTFSTYLGGAGADTAQAVAADAAGSTWVAGATASANFPLVSPIQAVSGGGAKDAFVARFDPAGTLLFSTYFGGSADESAYGIATDASGNAYAVGYTTSANFPLLAAYQPTYGGGSEDGFLVRLTAAGTLLSSTYLGGSVEEWALAVAVDSTGAAAVLGITSSANFPTVLPAQATFGGSYDAFITRFNPQANALIFSTFLGGSLTEITNGGIVYGPSSKIFVAGGTQSTDFPVTAGAWQGTFGGGNTDSWAASYTETGTLLWATYIGGPGDDPVTAIAVDPTGQPLIVGSTASLAFPVVNALQPTFGGGIFDAFAVRLNATGTAALFSTYLGGTGDEQGAGAGFDPLGNLYIAGSTSSTDFAVTGGALQATNGGGAFDYFLVSLPPNGSSRLFSTYFGGSGSDFAHGMTIDPSGTAHVLGTVDSTNFPTLGAAQAANGGGTDLGVTVIAFYDAGTFADAGSGSDAGTPDAGASDAGPSDGGASDGGGPSDGGGSGDAGTGVDGGPDAGFCVSADCPPSQAAFVLSCGCTSAAAGVPGLAVLLLTWLLARRPRSRVA